MSEGMEIRGGASEFEAAVIAVVLDRIVQEEQAAIKGPTHDASLPAWMRVDEPEQPNFPLGIVRPV